MEIDKKLNREIKLLLHPGPEHDYQPKYFRVLDAITSISSLSHTQKLVLSRILHHIGEDGSCFVSQVKLGVLLATSAGAINDAMRELRNNGLLDWVERPGETNQYQLTVKFLELVNRHHLIVQRQKDKWGWKNTIVKEIPPLGMSTPPLGEPVGKIDVSMPRGDLGHSIPDIDKPSGDIGEPRQTKNKELIGPNKKARTKKNNAPSAKVQTPAEKELEVWATGVYLIGKGYYARVKNDPEIYPPFDKRNLRLICREILRLGNGDHHLGTQKLAEAFCQAAEQFSKAGNQGWRVKYSPVPSRVCNADLLSELIGHLMNSDLTEIGKSADAFLEDAKAWCDEGFEIYKNRASRIASSQMPTANQSPERAAPPGMYFNEHGLLCRSGSI